MPNDNPDNKGGETLGGGTPPQPSPPEGTTAVKNLSALPFGSIIAAPLTAAVEAQASAARSTVDFIQEVGFTTRPGQNKKDNKQDNSEDVLEVLYVAFKYKIKDQQGIQKDGELQVPLLTIVPIPFIRISILTIDFVAKMTDAYQSNQTSQTILGTNLKNTTRLAGGGLFVKGSTQFQGTFSASHKSTSNTTNRYNNELTMTVHLEAGNDDIPAGMGRILGVLESNILDSEADNSSDNKPPDNK